MREVPGAGEDRLRFRQVAAGAAGIGALLALAGLAAALSASGSREISLAWVPLFCGAGFLFSAGTAGAAYALSTRPRTPVGAAVAGAAIAAGAGASAAFLVQFAIFLRGSGAASAGAAPALSAGLSGTLQALTWLGIAVAVANAAAAVALLLSRADRSKGRVDPFALAGLSLGIAGVILSFSVVGALTAPLALVLGGLGAWRTLNGERRGLGEAQAAIVFGLAMCVFYLVVLATRLKG
jgi:hypothetical protein